MSSDDGFLNRWSRRKQAARTEEPAEPDPADAGAAVSEPVEPVDLTALPPVESLGADSPLAPFLQKGIPESLRNAALRQVWESDPAIRDYIGPADYQWDFHTPGALTGFGALEPGTDVARMVADITDFHLKAPAIEPGLSIESDPVTALADAGGEAQMGAPENVETGPENDHHTDELAEDEPVLPAPRRRRHGGAAPA